MTVRDAVVSPADAHASDAELVRLLDGEATPRLAGDAEAHVAACADCSARLAQLRARSFSLSALLLATDPPTPSLDRLRPPARPSVRHAPRLRVAAALLVAAAGIAAAATPGVRGWIATRVSSETPSERGTAATRATPAPESGGAVIGFAVERAELAVHVMLPQTSGVLELRAGDDALVHAEVVHGASEGLVVLPGTLRISNHEGSTASYRVTLPPAITAVVVRVGGAAPRRVARAVVKEGAVRLPLSAR